MPDSARWCQCARTTADFSGALGYNYAVKVFGRYYSKLTVEDRRLYKMPQAIDFYIALLSIWVCCSVVANLSVIVCIWKTSRNRRKPTAKSLITSTDILLISLAVNDILLAGTVLPQKIYHLSHTDHHESASRTYIEMGVSRLVVVW